MADTQECARGSPVGPVKKACIPLLMQALDAYTQIKFQSCYYPLIIARDFGTLFLWVVQEGVLCERCVACTDWRGRAWNFLNWAFGGTSHHDAKILRSWK